MHQHLEVLTEELKLIRDNRYGDFKKNSNIHLTHSEVISFVRACVRAIETQIIDPFDGWDSKQKSQIMFFLDLIRTNGLCHCDRSRAAQRCLKIIDQFLEQESKKKLQDTQNDNDFDEIPF